MNKTIVSKIVGPALAGLSTLGWAGLAFADAPASMTAVPPCQPCAGPFTDARQSPFAYRQYIEGVAPYRASRTQGNYMSTVLEGATIELRAAPGVTAEWLQQYVNEHLALAH